MSKRQATDRARGKERKRQRVNVDGSGPQGLVVTALALSREGRMPVSVAETVFGSRATVGLPGYVSVDEERGELVLEKERLGEGGGAREMHRRLSEAGLELWRAGEAEIYVARNLVTV